jgi:hypothetical protein
VQSVGADRDVGRRLAAVGELGSYLGPIVDHSGAARAHVQDLGLERIKQNALQVRPVGGDVRCAETAPKLGGRDLAQQTAVPGPELATVAADADLGDPVSQVERSKRTRR